MTSENDRLRLFEVPFRISITGTRLIVAHNDAEATAVMKDLDAQSFTDAIEDSEVLNDHPVVHLKDGLNGTLETMGVQRCEKPEDYAEQFENDDRFQQVLDGPVEAAKPMEPRQGDDKPFDEDNDGIDKPGDDRLVGGNDAASRDARLTAHGTPAPQGPGPAIGPRGTKDGPQEQKTGAPTTATTSAGAVNPAVNRPAGAPFPATSAPKPGTRAPGFQPRPTPAPGKPGSAPIPTSSPKKTS